MFRRKTDQVYATLQQVQRRLTDATQAGDEGEIFGARPKPPPALPTDPLRAATAQAQAVNGQAPPASAPTTAPPPSPSTASFQRRNSLQFSGELATVLFLLWVVTLTAAFFIGKHVGGRAVAADPGAGYAAGAAGSRSTRSTTPAADPDTSASKPSANAGGYVLVLQSVARASAESEGKMGALARQLNEFADQNPRHGYKSWFAVRKPSNGGLQLVYGLVNDKFGIDKTGLEGFADTFDRAGYKESHWVRVDEQ